MHCSVGFFGPVDKQLSFGLGKTLQSAQFYIILVQFFFSGVLHYLIIAGWANFQPQIKVRPWLNGTVSGNLRDFA